MRWWMQGTLMGERHIVSVQYTPAVPVSIISYYLLHLSWNGLESPEHPGSLLPSERAVCWIECLQWTPPFLSDSLPIPTMAATHNSAQTLTHFLLIAPGLKVALCLLLPVPGILWHYLFPRNLLGTHPWAIHECNADKYMGSPVTDGENRSNRWI